MDADKIGMVIVVIAFARVFGGVAYTLKKRADHQKNVKLALKTIYSQGVRGSFTLPPEKEEVW